MKSLISVIFYLIGVLISHFLGKFFLRSLFESSVFSNIEDNIIKNFNLYGNLERLSLGSNDGRSFLFSTVGSNIVRVFFSRIIFVILFFCLFSFFKTVKSYLLKLTKITKKLPIIGTLDGFLGAFCGVLKAFFFLFIFAVVCFILIIFTRDDLPFLNTNVVNSTYLFFLFYKITYFLK